MLLQYNTKASLQFTVFILSPIQYNTSIITITNGSLSVKQKRVHRDSLSLSLSPTFAPLKNLHAKHKREQRRPFYSFTRPFCQEISNTQYNTIHRGKTKKRKSPIFYSFRLLLLVLVPLFPRIEGTFSPPLSCRRRPFLFPLIPLSPLFFPLFVINRKGSRGEGKGAKVVCVSGPSLSFPILLYFPLFSTLSLSLSLSTRCVCSLPSILALLLLSFPFFSYVKVVLAWGRR